MKNIYINIPLLILPICFATTILGQENKLNIGFEGGPSVIFLRGDAVGKTTDLGIGFSGGLSVQYNFSKVFSARTNLAYERKGAVFVSTTIDMNGVPVGQRKQHMNFDYLTFPILLRATFGKDANFFLNAGPFLGFLIKEKDTYKSTAKGYSYPPVDNTSSFKRTDAGISLGIGFAIPIKTKILFSLELRNNTGLSNIDMPDIYRSPILKTSSTSLLVGIAYKFGSTNTESK